MIWSFNSMLFSSELSWESIWEIRHSHTFGMGNSLTVRCNFLQIGLTIFYFDVLLHARHQFQGEGNHHLIRVVHVVMSWNDLIGVQQHPDALPFLRLILNLSASPLVSNRSCCEASSCKDKWCKEITKQDLPCVTNQILSIYLKSHATFMEVYKCC